MATERLTDARSTSRSAYLVRTQIAPIEEDDDNDDEDCGWSSVLPLGPEPCVWLSVQNADDSAECWVNV